MSVFCAKGESTMRVSVVVPIYNAERYLRQCLDSLAAQRLEGVEFLCVDDGSTDGSAAIACEYAKADSRFKVLSKPNGGYGHAVNFGFDRAEGDYVGILEADDFCVPDMFERLHAAAVEHDADVVRSSYNLYWSRPEERREFQECAPEAECGSAFDPRVSTGCFLLPPALWSMLVRRSLVAENGLRFLESPGASYQDTAFSFKVWACARRAVYVHEALLDYRQDNEASSINQKDKLRCVPEEYAELERFLREGGARFDGLLPIMMKRKFAAYAWNYDRLAAELHRPFADLAAEEFRGALSEGLMDQDLFSSDEWSDLMLLARDPERFVALRDGDGRGLRRFRRAERVRRALGMGSGR